MSVSGPFRTGPFHFINVFYTHLYIGYVRN